MCPMSPSDIRGTLSKPRWARIVCRRAPAARQPNFAVPQHAGSISWDIDRTLFEETLSDHRFGRFMKHNLAQYRVPANADIHDIDVIFDEEDDRIVSRIGAKGVGGDPHRRRDAPPSATPPFITPQACPMAPDKVLALLIVRSRASAFLVWPPRDGLAASGCRCLHQRIDAGVFFRSAQQRLVDVPLRSSLAWLNALLA